MSPTRHRRLLTTAGLITAIAAAITIPALNAAASPASTPRHQPQLTVLAPRPGQIVTTPELAIHVAVRHFHLDSRYAGTPDTVGLGHFHEIIDGRLIDMSPLPPDSTRDTVSMVGIEPGHHTLTIVPAGNDHQEVAAAAVNVPFTYAGSYLPEPSGYMGTGAPSIRLSAPTDEVTVTGSTLGLTAQVGNFVLCGDCFGKTNVAGEGHWHVFLDLPPTAMDPMTMMPHMMTMAGDTTTTVSLVAVPNGTHTITAVLVGNDHMPTMPMAMSTININVNRHHHHQD
jgi:hypothetical protein